MTQLTGATEHAVTVFALPLRHNGVIARKPDSPVTFTSHRRWGLEISFDPSRRLGDVTCGQLMADWKLSELDLGALSP